MHKILVVDDDVHILEMLQHILQEEGYEVVTARASLEGFKLAQTEAPDLCILDISLPQMDGVTLCQTLRAVPTLDNIPILFLTAQSNRYSVTDALEAGGDDYIRKPFATRELVARVRAHLRRATHDNGLPSVQIKLGTYQVFVNQREVHLTRIEFRILNYLAQKPGQWYTVQQLLENVWEYPPDVGDRALVRNHVRNVRRKLEDNPEKPSIIQSRPGRGYTLRAMVSTS